MNNTTEGIRVTRAAEKRRREERARSSSTSFIGFHTTMAEALNNLEEDRNPLEYSRHTVINNFAPEDHNQSDQTNITIDEVRGEELMEDNLEDRFGSLLTDRERFHFAQHMAARGEVAKLTNEVEHHRASVVRTQAVNEVLRDNTKTLEDKVAQIQTERDASSVN